MTAEATLIHYFVLLFRFKMIPVPAGYSQGGILGVPPLSPYQKLSIYNHFHSVYCAARSDLCKDNVSFDIH